MSDEFLDFIEDILDAMDKAYSHSIVPGGLLVIS